MRGFFYCLKEGLKGFQRARLSGFLSVVSFMVAALLIGSFLLLTINLQQFVQSIKDRLEIEIFIDNALDEQQMQHMQTQISAFAGIAKIEYISKEAAAEFLKKEFGKDVFSILDENPLPASFRIHLLPGYQQVDQAQVLVEQLKKVDGVDEVVFRRDVLLLLDKYLKWFMMFLLAGGLLVCLGTLFFVYNTIRLIIFSRRDIIEAMKLVGATPGFIRLPFIIEGFVQAISGTGIALILLYLVSGILHSLFPYFSPMPMKLSLSLLIGGILVGFWGSTIAIRRFLKY